MSCIPGPFTQRDTGDETDELPLYDSSTVADERDEPQPDEWRFTCPNCDGELEKLPLLPGYRCTHCNHVEPL